MLKASASFCAGALMGRKLDQDEVLDASASFCAGAFDGR